MEYVIIILLSIIIVVLYLRMEKEKTNDNKKIVENNKIEAKNSDNKKRFNLDIPELSLISDSDYKNLLKKFYKEDGKLLIPLGYDRKGNIQKIDLNESNNMLIFGTTGGGKSVLLDELLTSIIMNYKSDEVKFITIDSSIVELSSFNGIPHYIKDTISDMTMASNELEHVAKEIEKRKKQETIKEHLFVIIDDIYDLAYGQEKYINNLLIELMKESRNTKVHIIAATDTPCESTLFKNYSDLFDIKCYLTLAPGTYHEFDKKDELTQEDLDFLATIGNMVLISNNEKSLIKVTDILDEDIKEIVKYYSI